MRDRTRYESQILYVGPSYLGYVDGGGADTIIDGYTPAQLQKIQRIESSVETNKDQVHEMGTAQFKTPRFSSLGSAVKSPMDISLEFEYALADAFNERLLGFTLSDLDISMVSGMAVKDNHGEGSGALSPFRGEQNFYILTKNRGDAVTTGDTQFFLTGNSGMGDASVMCFGNGVVDRYVIGAAVDEIPVATVTVNANNVAFATGCSGIAVPTVTSAPVGASVSMPAPAREELKVDALRPGYINLSFGTGVLEGGGPLLPGNNADEFYSPCSLDNFLITVDLPRRINQRLGNKFPLSKPIRFPTQVTMECTAKSRDVVSGNLIDVFCSGDRNILIELSNPASTGLVPEGNIKIGLSGAHLQNYNYNHNLFNNETVNLEFVVPLYTGTELMGISMSGVASDSPYSTTYGITETELLSNHRRTV